MIHSTNTFNINGKTLKDEEIFKAFTFGNDDKFTQWVVRPLAIMTVISLGIAMFFASAFLIVLSLAMVPLLALSFWAIKMKVERDLAKSNPVVGTQSASSEESRTDTQTAI